MGLLVDGVWQDQWYDTDKSGGRFERQPTSIRSWVTADGRAGPSGEAGCKAQPGRYHLYVCLACPWASRTVIARKLKGIEDIVGMSLVSYHMGKTGWTFDTATGSTGDPVNGANKLSDIYLKHDPHFTGRVTVPVLWDKERGQIVNNESSEILRMFDTAFDDFTPVRLHLYPQALREEIERINAIVYPHINNGVYRAGFATTQVAYEEAFRALFEALDDIESLLGRQRHLVGSAITEADWRLFTTLIRFDAVYFGHFKCNLRRVVDYPNLSNYTRELYQVPGVAQTVNFEHIKRHYYGSHPTINPTGIVPLGPHLDFHAPHDRARFA